MKDDHLSHEQLYAYGDGLLSAAERSAVERHLATCAACAARHDRSTKIIQALKGHLGQTRAPASLRTSILRQVRARDSQVVGQGRVRPRALAMASLAIAALILALVLTVASRSDGGPSLVTQLIEAHHQLVQEPQRVQIQGNAVALSKWIEGQLDDRIDLSAPEGFSLVGGRLDKVDNQFAAHVLYRQANAMTMSLFVWRGDFPTDRLLPREVQGSRFYIGAQGEENAVLWHARDVSYACVGSMSLEALVKMAASIRQNDID